MKVIAKTDEYTVYQKRSERYAVRKNDRAWINGEEKVAILLEHKLITAPPQKAPEPEATEEAAPETDASAEGGAEDGAEDAPAES